MPSGLGVVATHHRLLYAEGNKDKVAIERNDGMAMAEGLVSTGSRLLLSAPGKSSLKTGLDQFLSRECRRPLHLDSVQSQAAVHPTQLRATAIWSAFLSAVCTCLCSAWELTVIVHGPQDHLPRTPVSFSNFLTIMSPYTDSDILSARSISKPHLIASAYTVTSSSSLTPNSPLLL